MIPRNHMPAHLTPEAIGDIVYQEHLQFNSQVVFYFPHNKQHNRFCLPWLKQPFLAMLPNLSRNTDQSPKAGIKQLQNGPRSV